jgi:hypothetical protein
MKRDSLSQRATLAHPNAVIDRARAKLVEDKQSVVRAPVNPKKLRRSPDEQPS